MRTRGTPVTAADACRGDALTSRGFVRRLPGPIRRPVIQGANWLQRYLEARAIIPGIDPVTLSQLERLPGRQGRAYDGSRVAVVGLFSRPCGLQRGADLMVQDLRAQGRAVLAVDLTQALNVTTSSPLDPGCAAPDDLLAFHPTDVVIHLNPPMFARGLALLPHAALSQAAIIGYWAWELSEVPSAWSQSAHYVDAIWAPSPFVSDALMAGMADDTGRKIRVVPHAVDRDPMPRTTPKARLAARRLLGLPQERFVAGLSFSFDSNYARKNPCAAIDSFRLAFRGDEAATLLIRCNDAATFPRLFEHLKSYAGSDARIRILDTSLQPVSIRQFYAQLDLYLSLHRGEGYGLNLAEATQAGVPVIATGWGLAPDIAERPHVRTVGYRLVVPLDPQRFYDSFPGALWAEPDMMEAADLLCVSYNSWNRANFADARVD